MNESINSYLAVLNNIGRWFCDYGTGLFIQSGILIILLLIIDLLIRKRVRATFRYWMWMLVLLKLMLPPAFSLPTGIGHWFGDYLPAHSSVSEQVPNTMQLEPAGTSAPKVSTLSAEIPQVHPSQASPEPVSPAIPVNSDLQALTWQAAVFVLWFMGVAILSVLLIHRMLFVRRMIARSEPAKNRYADLLDHCCQQLEIRSKTKLRLSGKLQSPAVCGLFRPVILMPTGLLERLSPDKLKAVLIHELAHIKRGDLWVNCVQTFLQIIYFYNPLVWLANAVVRRIREQAVDEMVLAALGSGTKSYSNTLIDIAEMAFFKTSLSLRLIGVVESSKALNRRIRHMLNRPIPKSTKVGVFGTIAIIVAAAVLLPMAKAQKQDPDIVESEQINSQFTATLPDGVVVELVGVCEHPSAGRQWWRPDGTPIEADEFPDYDYDDAVTVKENEHARLLAFRLDDTVVQGAKISWSLEDSRESRFAPDYVDRSRAKRQTVQVILAAFPAIIESTNLRLGIAAGPWKSVAAGTNGQTTAYARDTIAQRAIIYNEASEENGITHITATHLVDADYDCRIYARGKDREVYEPRKYTNSGSEMRLCKSEFDIPVEKVKLFHLQARPFQWLTFKNISLQPAVKTDMQIEVGSDTKQVYTKSLQSIIDSAKSGDIVTVPKGLYKEPVEIKKSLILKGESQTECIFEVTANEPAIFVDTKGKGKVVVRDLTIKWQLATGDKGIERPFALGVKDSKAEVKNCSFIPLGDFRRSPVAVRADGFSELNISKCRFEGFEYVICYGEGTKGKTSDCLIMNCGHQGIINYSGSTLHVERNVITGSKFHAVRCTGGTLHVRDNLLIKNANRGIYLGNKSGTGSITNNLIIDNGTGIGAFARAKYEIKNNVIADSIYAGIGMQKSCFLTIQDNIFVNNERGWIMFDRGAGGGNSCRKNTFWKNKVDTENFSKTANSIKDNPNFIDPENGDFSLNPSPALENKQGLTNPQIFKELWKIWKNRENKK